MQCIYVLCSVYYNILWQNRGASAFFLTQCLEGGVDRRTLAVVDGLMRIGQWKVLGVANGDGVGSMHLIVDRVGYRYWTIDRYWDRLDHFDGLGCGNVDGNWTVYWYGDLRAKYKGWTLEFLLLRIFGISLGEIVTYYVSIDAL